MPRLNEIELKRMSRFLQWSPTGCLLWMGSKNPKGYGRTSIGPNQYSVHRLFYETFVGPIPPDKVMDHLCRTRNCANPNHLRCVTEQENILAGISPSAIAATKTHCPAGHPYAGENLRITGRGFRVCRTCESIYNKRRNGENRHAVS